MWLSLLALALAATTTIASPIVVEERSLERRASTSYCGQWDHVAIGTSYTLYLDQWGISGATGSQCASATILSGTTISWTTTWTWITGTGVKSFTNIAAATGLNKQLSAISTIPTSWSWAQNTNAVVANVAYILFTSSTSGGVGQYEIMIWLANYNAGPISYNYSSSGAPIPIGTVTIGARTWSVYYGSDGTNLVYSFLPPANTVIASFSADLKLYLTYLITYQGLPSSQYLITAEAGTEATSGTGVILTTTSYSLAIN